MIVQQVIRRNLRKFGVFSLEKVNAKFSKGVDF